MRKVIITCAVTGAAEHTHINPAVPITPEEIADECLSAHEAGAAIVHIHVRDPDTGKPSMEESLYMYSDSSILGFPVSGSLTCI